EPVTRSRPVTMNWLPPFGATNNTRMSVKGCMEKQKGPDACACAGLIWAVSTRAPRARVAMTVGMGGLAVSERGVRVVHCSSTSLCRFARSDDVRWVGAVAVSSYLQDFRGASVLSRVRGCQGVGSGWGIALRLTRRRHQRLTLAPWRRTVVARARSGAP